MAKVSKQNYRIAKKLTARITATNLSFMQAVKEDGFSLLTSSGVILPACTGAPVEFSSIKGTHKPPEGDCRDRPHGDLR
jgi:hypothetical protein